MKLSKQNITRTVGRKVLTVKKNSPHIFFAAGVVGFAGTVVMACKATMKLEKTIDEIHEDLDNVKGMGESAREMNPEGEYAQGQYHKDLLYVYGKSTVKLGRLYGPSIILGVASVGALTGSHVQLTRRNSALTATAAAISKAYDEYRVRIQEELGEEKELDIYRGITEEETKDENGKKVRQRYVDTNAFSVYARMFEESNMNWRNNNEMNRLFIQSQQNYANHLLHARGHVFLNEVYDSLGLERSKAGQVVGWVLEGDGDGYIDFGLFEARNSEFLNGHEPCIILDFNVDGVVYDKF